MYPRQQYFLHNHVGIMCLMLLIGCADPEVYVQKTSTSEGGSGRYYMNREIADVMSSEHGALWLDRPGRNVEELPNRLFDVLELNPSAIVADIGSGTGFFTFLLADIVSHGRVYSVEVQPSLVDTLSARSERLGLRNVVPVLGSEVSPNLPSGKMDLVLIVASYHEFTFPREMIQSILESLKPGARLVVVEYRLEDDTIGVEAAHRMSEEQIKREVESVGFKWRETRDVLPQQHVIIFNRPVD